MPTDSVRHRIDISTAEEPIEIYEEIARDRVDCQLIDVAEEELKALLTGDIPFPRPKVAVGSHEEKVMQATFRYITAYTGCKNAATEIERAKTAVAAALEYEKTAAAEQESARDELFDLIAVEDSKPA